MYLNACSKIADNSYGFLKVIELKRLPVTRQILSAIGNFRVNLTAPMAAIADIPFCKQLPHLASLSRGNLRLLDESDI
ncbi:MAG: hypothetical protein VKJ02_00035 [Snowella sp.]|nr:hypothetical protein [Snowella sp.]